MKSRSRLPNQTASGWRARTICAHLGVPLRPFFDRVWTVLNRKRSLPGKRLLLVCDTLQLAVELPEELLLADAFAASYAKGFGPMRRPPSMQRDWPVVKEDLSEQSHRTASDTSLGVPKRPRGCKARTRLLSSGSLKARAAMSVWITAGQTAFTRMPSLAHSAAAVLVSPSTPCLLAI